MALDRALLYVTGGVAFANIKNTVYYVGYDPLTINGWRTGWVGGAGVEYAITNNWTVRAEGLYYKFNEKRGIYNDSSLYRHGVDTSALVARVGVNYKFGGGSSAPVLARY